MVMSMVRGEVKIKNVDVERAEDGKKTKPVVFLDPHSDGASNHDSSSDAELALMMTKVSIFLFLSAYRISVTKRNRKRDNERNRKREGRKD